MPAYIKDMVDIEIKFHIYLTSLAEWLHGHKICNFRGVHSFNDVKKSQISWIFVRNYFNYLKQDLHS